LACLRVVRLPLVHAGFEVFLQPYPLSDDATVQYMIASSEDVLVDGHYSSNGFPQDRYVLASLRHIQMNSIRDMAPHEASPRAYLDGDAVHNFIEPPIQNVQMDPFVPREVPDQRRLNGLASGLRHVQEHETRFMWSCFGT
jgi:hypothetical protein